MTQADTNQPTIGAAGTLMLMACFFLAVGVAAGAFLLIKLAVPVLFDATGALSYGRLRPAVYTLLVYGAGGCLTQASAYFLFPRLSGAPLRWEKAAVLNGYAYGGLIMVGTLLVMLRGPSGPMLMEFPPVIDWLVAASLVAAAVIATETLRRRTEEGSYVTALYLLAAVWWYPALYVIGAIPGLGGMGTFLQAGFVSGGLLTVAFPAACLGGAYFVLMKDSRHPLYSGSLARAGFWTLAGTGLLASPARFMSGPAPSWLEAIAAIASLGLVVSALAVAANFFLTLAGDWAELKSRPALQTVMAGVFAYSVVTALTGISGFRSTAAVVGFTTWQEGLDLGLIMVAIPLLGAGFMLYAFPNQAGREVFSARTVNAGVRLAMWGGGAMVLLLAISGLVSGLTWNWANSSGGRLNIGIGFSATLETVAPFYTVAALAAVVAAAGIVLLSWSVVRTYTSGAAQPVEVLVPAESGEGDIDE